MRRIFILMAILALIFGFYHFMHSSEKELEIRTSGSSVGVKAEIADDPVGQARGLMFRQKLEDGEGMLFIFVNEERRSFWMKNMLIPLDMIFIDGNGYIVDIIENVPPCSAYPCPAYTSSFPARYVLEVGSGFSQKNNVSVGDIAKIP